MCPPGQQVSTPVLSCQLACWALTCLLRGQLSPRYRCSGTASNFLTADPLTSRTRRAMLNATLRARTGQPVAPQVQHSLRSLPAEARTQAPHQRVAVLTPSRLQRFPGSDGLIGAGLEGPSPAPGPVTVREPSLEVGAQQGTTRSASLRTSVSLGHSELRGVPGCEPTGQPAAGSADPLPADTGHSAAGLFGSLSVSQSTLQPQESWARQLQLHEEEDQPAAAAAAVAIASASQQMQGTGGSNHGIIQSLNRTQVGAMCTATYTSLCMPCQSSSGSSFPAMDRCQLCCSSCQLGKTSMMHALDACTIKAEQRRWRVSLRLAGTHPLSLCCSHLPWGGRMPAGTHCPGSHPRAHRAG